MEHVLLWPFNQARPLFPLTGPGPARPPAASRLRSGEAAAAGPSRLPAAAPAARRESRDCSRDRRSTVGPGPSGSAAPPSVDARTRVLTPSVDARTPAPPSVDARAGVLTGVGTRAARASRVPWPAAPPSGWPRPVSWAVSVPAAYRAARPVSDGGGRPGSSEAGRGGAAGGDARAQHAALRPLPPLPVPGPPRPLRVAGDARGRRGASRGAASPRLGWPARPMPCRAAICCADSQQLAGCRPERKQPCRGRDERCGTGEAIEATRHLPETHRPCRACLGRGREGAWPADY